MFLMSPPPPLCIRVNARDNVAVVVQPEGLAAGTHLPDGPAVVEAIPQGHKVALRDVDAGQPVVRYGEVIGHATRPIPAGAWVREELVALPEPPPLDQLPLATAVPAALPPLAGQTFDGYRNSDGSFGTKNLLGITTTVQCVAATVDYAVERIQRELLPKFPNVDGVVAITHAFGCGVAIEAPGTAIPIRTLRHISTHPNVGAAPLVVGLGCEKLQPERLFPPGQSPLPVLGDEL